jgi:hypothetical protein
LDKVEKRQPTIYKSLCDANDKSQVGFNKFLSGALDLCLSTDDSVNQAFEPIAGQPNGYLNASHLSKERETFLFIFHG